MNNIALKDSKDDFDLDGYLSDQGMQVVSKSPRLAANNLRNRGDVVYQVKDKDGKEFDFDAHAFLRDQGMEPDLKLNFEREQKASIAMKDAKQANEDNATRKEMDEAGLGEYLARTVFPYTRSLVKSGKMDSDSPSLAAGLSVPMDLLSLIPRGGVGAYESLKKHITGKGKDLDVSMAGVSSYGADKIKDADTGEEREENLGEHWDSFKAAVRVDPAGVGKALFRESIRDPLTGVSLLTAGSTAGATAPLAGSRAALLMAKIAKQYKPVQGAVSAVKKTGDVFTRVQKHLEKANVVEKLAAGITKQGVEGGIQGVIGKYAMGEDQDAWNTFVIEGLEEGAFGGIVGLANSAANPALQALAKSWNNMSKAEQIDGLNDYRDGLKQSKPHDQGVDDAEFTSVDKLRLPPGSRPMLTSGQVEGKAGITINPMDNGTIVGQQLIGFDAQLPAGVSRQEVIKKIENPNFKTTSDIATEKAEAETRKNIQKDIKAVKAESIALQAEVQKHITTATETVLAEIEAEEKDAAGKTAKANEEFQKDLEVLSDPSKPTNYPAWVRLVGHNITDLSERQKAFEDFHVDEAKKIKAIQERINPTEDGEIKAEPSSLPGMADYQKHQDGIDALEDKLSGKYGEKAVLDDNDESIPAEERGKLQGLYKTRDTVGKKMDDELLAEVMNRVPESGPVSKAFVHSILQDVQSDANMSVAMGHKVPKPDRKSMILKKVFGALSQKAFEQGDFPFDLVGDLDEAERSSESQLYGTSPKPVLKQAKAVVDAIFGKELTQSGGQDGEAENTGNGSGEERNPGPDGGEASLSELVEGEDRGNRPSEPGNGPENGAISELPREPRDPRPVDTEDDLLPANQQVVKAEHDAQFHKDPEYRPIRAAAWGNVDLRKKPPIELTPAKRVAMNQHGKEILDQYDLDPSTLNEAGREVLRHYTGQGGLGIKADDEASSGILNQHYTSYPVVKFSWDALAATGFPMDRRLTALEPTAGIGNFIGHKPDNVDFHANEVDKDSARALMALYPQNITNREGPFESYFGPKVDVVITNVPFLSSRGAYGHLETDPKYKGIRSLHNYIMMKGIDQLHDNGVGVFITSTGTMDAQTGAEFRKQFNQKAEILSAFRLPEGTFDKNTQYKGTVDMILVRKRTRGEIASVEPEDRVQKEWVDTKRINVKSDTGQEGEAIQTAWYDKHPEGVLGEFVYGHNRHIGQTGVQLKLKQGEDLNRGLQRVFAKALETLKDKYAPAPGAESDPNLAGVGESVGRASESTPVFGLEVVKGRVYRKARDGELRAFRPELNPKGKPWDVPESRFVLLTSIMKEALFLKEETLRVGDVGNSQKRLKSLLNEWKALPKYPRQSMHKGASLFPGVKVTARMRGDRKVSEAKFNDGALDSFAGPDKRYNLLVGLYDKTLMGFGRALTEAPTYSIPPSIKEPSDLSNGAGIVDFLIKKNGIFTESNARELFSGTPSEFEAEMMNVETINVHDGEFIHDWEYLQGDLGPKVEYSKKMGLKKQLNKLTPLLPKQRTFADVPAIPTSTWWDSKALTAFAKSKAGLGSGLTVGRIAVNLKDSFHIINNGESIGADRGTDLYEFVQTALNQRPVPMPDPDGKMNSKDEIISVPDHIKTQQIKKKWNELFEEWARGPGIDYAKAAAEKFNKDYASMSTNTQRETPLFIEGLSQKLDGRTIEFYGSQMSGVRRAQQLNGALLAWGVGHGKTIGAIMIHQERRNRGVTKKAIYVVPAMNLGMWHSNLTQMIPGLQVKIISSEASQKRIDMVDAANNHYDAILVSYDTFKTIPLAKSIDYTQEDLEKFKAALLIIETQGGSKAVTAGIKKRMEEKIVKVQNKLNKMMLSMKDPQGITTFEDLDTDTIFMDEAHTVKNSYEQMHEYADRPFLNKSTDSTVGNDMVHKTRFMHERNGRGGVFLLTATPTPNNPLEIYKIIKLVAPHEWTSRGIHSADDFIRNFVEIGPISVPGIDGTVASQQSIVEGQNAKVKEGIVGWTNSNARRAITNKWMDFRKDNDEVKKPESYSIVRSVEMNDAQQEAMAEILVLSGLSIKEQKEQGVNAASLTQNAKSVAVDPALLNQDVLKEYPNFMDRAPKLKEAMRLTEKHFKANPDRHVIIALDVFNLGGYEPLLSKSGAPVEWPYGFGYLGNDEDGETIRPKWFEKLEETQKKMIVSRLKQSGAVNWPIELMDNASRPVKVTESSIEDYQPVFEDDGRVTIKVWEAKGNLHEEMAKYAIEKIGMDPARVVVVNGKKNNKPADKTRIEQMVADGLISLIIGNKPSMGQGLNLQAHSDALINVDVPWTPKELEQLYGRVWRPRTDVNDKHPVSIYNIISVGSLDAKGYSVIAGKEKWQREMYVGTDDYQDNTLNNLEDAGFSYKDMSESATVGSQFVYGYTMASNVRKDAKALVESLAEYDRKLKHLETLKKNLEAATGTVDNARDNIKKGMEKAESEGKPYLGSKFWEDVITNNVKKVEHLNSLLPEYIEKLKPYEHISVFAETNRRAMDMVKAAKANRWATFSAKAEESEEYDNLLNRVMPEINARYPALASMMAAKAFNGSMPDKIEDAEAKLTKFIAGIDKGNQSGKASTTVIFGIPLMAGLAAYFGPVHATEIVGGLSLAVWGFKKMNMSEWIQRGTWSVGDRLELYPSYAPIKNLFGQANRVSRLNTGKASNAILDVLRPLTEAERLLMADKVEDPSLSVPPNVERAANVWRRVAASIATAGAKVDLGLAPDERYYPRELDWERIQLMKGDPKLLDRQIDHLMMKQGLSQEDAYGLLVNYFDNSEEMRIEKYAKLKREMMAAMRRRNPNITDQELVNAYLRMKNTYGERVNGSLRYARTSPKLTNDMYIRDPLVVLPKYLERTHKTIAYRHIFGPNLEMINDFLDTEFPLMGDKPSIERERVKEFIDVELYHGRFAPQWMDDSDKANKIAGIVGTYNTWTKLFTSVLSPVRNIAFGTNMAIPLAGGRNTIKGIMDVLLKGTNGFKNARIAGAITDRAMRDMYAVSKGEKNTVWEKVKGADWHPFMITERFIRAFAFHAGQYRCENLFRKALKGDKRALKELTDELGGKRMGAELMDKKLSQASKDLYGLSMADNIGGSTRPMNLPRWMNTPEGTILGQFRRVAYDQTRVLKNKVFAPARRGDFGPLMRWGATVGVSLYVLAQLKSMVYGSPEDDDKKKERTAGQQAWDFMQYTNGVNAFGLWGDIANGINSGNDWGDAPLLGTIAGPTLSSVLHIVKDIYLDAPNDKKARGLGPELKQIARREIPLLGHLAKWDVPGFDLLQSERESKKNRYQIIKSWGN